GGSEAGFAAFDKWSQKSAKYNAAVTREKWEQLFRSPPNEIGAGTIFHMADQASPGWRGPDDRPIKDLNETYALVKVGDKVVIMNTSGDEISFMTVSAFETWFVNRSVYVPPR